MAKKAHPAQHAPGSFKKPTALVTAVLDALPSHIAILDEAGVIRVVNKAWRRFAQEHRCQDQVFYVGTNYLSVCEHAFQRGDQMAGAALRGLGAVLRGEQDSFDLEYPCHDPEQERWFVLHATRLQATSGLLVVHENVTAHSRLLARLAAYEKLVANVNDVIIATDASFKIQFWNAAAEHIFGWKPHEVIGRSAAEVLQTVFSETDRAESIRSLEEHGRWLGEVTQFTRDGRPLVFEANIISHYKYDGSVAGYISANRNITERKQTELALQASETRFRHLTASLPDTVYTLDLETLEVAYLNRDSFLGYSSNELMASNSILNQMHPEDTPTVLAYWQAMMQGQETGSLEYRLRNKAGAWEWIESRMSIISRNVRGAPKEIMIILTIITKRKQAEAELREAKATLEILNHDLQEVLAREAQMARTDELTQVHNRRLFFEFATRELAVAQRYGAPLALILFDIDYFKAINDTFGHQVGDMVLRQIAPLAQAQVREVDLLARYGGEEFIVLLPHSTGEQAFALAERMRESIANHRVDTARGSVSVTVSLGVAELASEHDTLDLLIQRADQALYEAKAEGRNCTRAALAAG